MDCMKKTWAVLLLPLCLAGCVTNTITNLTPSQQFRNEKGYYPVELAWNSNQQSLRDSTVTPYVVSGFDVYPMRPTIGVSNRWEAFVPISTNLDVFTYHFKVDYEYNQMGSKAGRDSKMSRVYTLRITEE